MNLYKEIASTVIYKTLKSLGKRIRKSEKYRAFVTYLKNLLEQPTSKYLRMSRMKKFAKYGGGMFMFGLVFGFMLFPKILKFAIHKQVNLKPGTDVRGVWSKIPFYFHFKIFLFNVTNPDEIKSGQKPILKQVGPYYFEEWHEKENIIDFKTDDTVEYSMKDTFYFRPDMSGGLTGEEELMLPHVFILGLVMATLREKPSAMPVVNKAINNIFKNPENAFVKTKAMDLMFRGLPVDCSVKDTASTAICNIVRENADAFTRDDEDHFRFSLLGAKNGTAGKERFKSFRGVKKQMDIGRVIEYNGKTNMSKWDDEYCDTFNGTDGYVFHPYLYDDEDIVSFAAPLCRSLSATFERKSKTRGLKTNRYTLWLGDPNTIPEQQCYCPANGCLKAGVMDLHKCIGVPLVASHPHFWRADSAYLDMVEGLSPNYEDHAIQIDFEPFSGSPIAAKKRLQFNIMIFKVDKFKIMKNFPEALLPLFWIEDEFILSKELVGQVKLLHRAKGFIKFMCIMMILGGIGCGGYAGFMFYQEKQAGTIQVTKVASKNGNKSGENNGDTKLDGFNLNNNMNPSQVPPPID